MIQQVLDRHQIGQAFHDFFSTLAAFATTIVATEFQLLCPIEKLLPYKAKIFLVHHFSKPTKMLLRKLEAEKKYKQSRTIKLVLLYNIFGYKTIPKILLRFQAAGMLGRALFCHSQTDNKLSGNS